MKTIKTLKALKSTLQKKFGKWADLGSRVFGQHRVRSLEAVGGDDYDDHSCDPAGAIGYVEVMFFGPTSDDIRLRRDIASDDDMAIRDWLKAAGLEILEVSDITGDGAGGGKDYWVGLAK